MQNVWFVTGIDTDVGKTISTGWLAQRWLKEGFRTITQKLVQMGANNGSPDIEVHRSMMGKRFAEDLEGLTASEVFSYPCSPHLASEIDERPINFEKILTATETLAQRYDRVWVEGAGGIMVPLTRDLLTIDFIAQMQWPVVFVTSGKLGSISHTLLSFEAMRNRSIKLTHLIFNDWHPQPDKTIDEDTYRFIRHRVQIMWPEVEILRCPKLKI